MHREAVVVITRIRQALARFGDRGVTAVEYGLIIAGVGLAVVGGLFFLRDSLSGAFETTASGEGVCVGTACEAFDTLPEADMPVVPVVAAPEATNGTAVVGSTSATLRGTVDPNFANTTVTFCYGTNSSMAGCTEIAAAESPLSAQGSPVSVSRTVAVAPNTPYYYVVRASNSAGSDTGDPPSSFTTAAAVVVSAPTVSNGTATLVTTTSATLRGSVNPNNAATTVTFCYGTNPSMGTCAEFSAAESPLAAGDVAVPVSLVVTGLVPNTTYYYEVRGDNSASAGTPVVGTPPSSFATGVAAPTATTQAATSVTGVGATLNGSVNPNNSGTNVTFCYGTSSTLAGCTSVNATESPLAAGTTDASVSAGVSGLTPNQTYYFQVRAANPATASGSVLSFTTSLPPTSTTNAASVLDKNTVVFNGTVNPNNASTTVSFCYRLTSDGPAWNTGTNTCAGTSVTATQSPLAASLSASAVSKQQNVTKGSTYNYVVVATNSAGTQAGTSQSFTTPAT